MKNKFPEICHQFDVWHLAKSVSKKLVAASKRKDCQDLGQWIKAITNHFWWCADTCNGSVVQIDQMAEWYGASASGSVDLGFDSESGQTNDFKIGIHSFPA